MSDSKQAQVEAILRRVRIPQITGLTAGSIISRMNMCGAYLSIEQDHVEPADIWRNIGLSVDVEYQTQDEWLLDFAKQVYELHRDDTDRMGNGYADTLRGVVADPDIDVETSFWSVEGEAIGMTGIRYHSITLDYDTSIWVAEHSDNRFREADAHESKSLDKIMEFNWFKFA